MTTFRYPAQGRARYQVDVANDGAIGVQRNDILTAYSMAIHGVPWEIYEYARMRGGRLSHVEDPNRIVAGETLYHIPTWNSHGTVDFSQASHVRIQRRAPTPIQQEQAVRQFLQRDARMPRPRAEAVAKAIRGLNVARTGIVLAELAGSGAAAAAAPFAAIAAAIFGTIGNVIALVNASETGDRIAGRIGYCYATTAWAYGESKPGFSAQLERNHRMSHGTHGLDGSKQFWRTYVDQAFEDCPRSAREQNISQDTLRVVLKAQGDNDKAKTCLKLAEESASQISGIERDAFLNAVRSGCQYNA